MEPVGNERRVSLDGSGPWDGTVEVLAAAKLTLSLRVVSVRPDGYHDIESNMVTLDLADTLEIGPGDGLTIEHETSSAAIGAIGAIGVAGGEPDNPVDPSDPAALELAVDPTLLAGPDNLVNRALRSVHRTAQVRLIKRIPLGAGLGGGSADAAAVLRWAGCTDLTVAAKLGADVPFCVVGGQAMVKGIGELVTPLAHKEREFTLLLLPFGVDTAAVYQTWDSLTRRGWSPVQGSATNDLEVPAISVEPRLALWRDLFASVTGLEPRLAGSGSTWFVEGSPDAIELRGQRNLVLGGARARLISAKTVAAPVQ